MITFQREFITPQLWLDILPQIAAHWSELNPSSDIPFNPDVRTYEECDAAGILRIFTARHEGRLVGYSIFYVRPGIHCRDVLMASHDALFVERSARGLTGARFIIWCDEQLRKEGVRTVSQNSRLDHDIGPMLKRLGYKPQEMVYVRQFTPTSKFHNETYRGRS